MGKTQIFKYNQNSNINVALHVLIVFITC